MFDEWFAMQQFCSKMFYIKSDIDMYFNNKGLETGIAFDNKS